MSGPTIFTINTASNMPINEEIRNTHACLQESILLERPLTRVAAPAPRVNPVLVSFAEPLTQATPTHLGRVQDSNEAMWLESSTSDMAVDNEAAPALADNLPVHMADYKSALKECYLLGKQAQHSPFKDLIEDFFGKINRRESAAQTETVPGAERELLALEMRMFEKICQPEEWATLKTMLQQTMSIKQVLIADQNNSAKLVSEFQNVHQALLAHNIVLHNALDSPQLADDAKAYIADLFDRAEDSISDGEKWATTLRELPKELKITLAGEGKLHLKNIKQNNAILAGLMSPASTLA